MPFDPKLVRGADAPLRADGEIELPDELTALADQLRDDAALLAATYPGSGVDYANQSVDYRSASPQSTPDPFSFASRATLRFLSATAAILVVSLTTALLFWRSPDSRPSIHNLQTEQSAEFTSTSPPTTTVSLTDLSSPELEALLDLVERQPDTISVSF